MIVSALGSVSAAASLVKPADLEATSRWAWMIREWAYHVWLGRGEVMGELAARAFVARTMKEVLALHSGFTSCVVASGHGVNPQSKFGDTIFELTEVTTSSSLLQ